MRHRTFSGNKKNTEVKRVDQEMLLPLPKDLLRRNLEPFQQYSLFFYTTEEDRATLATASNQFAQIPEYQEALEAQLKKLLQHTAKGEAEEAEKIAEHNYSLILRKTDFKEEWCGQREWKEISPLEYAAWAGDQDLVKNYLRKLRSLPLKLKEEALEEARQQLRKVQREGTEHGKHLAPIYGLLAKYEFFLSKIGLWTRTQLNTYWIQELGKSQLCSVVNLLQWYCSSSVFYPRPQFNQALSRSLELLQGDLLDLSSGTGLGREFSLGKGFWNRANCCRSQWMLGPKFPAWDCAALNSFCDTRTKDLAKELSLLELELKSQEDKGQNLLKKSRCSLV